MSLQLFSLSYSACIALAAIIVGLLALATCIYNYFFHPISNIKGPFIASISPIWLMRAVYRRRLNEDIQKLHSKYGSVVRIAPNELSFASIEAQTTIHNPGAEVDGYFTKKGTMESTLGKIVWQAENVLTTTDKNAHKLLRSSLLPAFTSKALLEQEQVQQYHVKKLIQNLDIALRARAEVNLTTHLSATLWDLIGDLSFGEALVRDQLCRFELLKGTFCQLSPLLEALQYLTKLPVVGGFVNWSIGLIPSLFRLPTNIIPSIALRECMNRQDGRKDFLTAIMECGVPINNAEMMSNSSLLVMVGYDTTATTLSAVFYFLLKNPQQMRKLKQELRTRFRHLDEINGTALLKLPFLNGCIQEALRLLPPANGKGTNRTSPGAFVDGIYVPSGVNVSADMYSIQRSPKYWFEAEQFRPERWFDHGPGTVFEKDVRSANRPFLLGPRVCLGREIAMQTLRIVVAKVAFQYDLEMVDREKYVWEKETDSSYLWIGYRVLVQQQTSESMKERRKVDDGAIVSL